MSAADVDPTGRFLVLAAYGGVGLWELVEQREILKLTHEIARSAWFTPEADEIIAATDEGVYAWRIERTDGSVSIGEREVLLAEQGWKWACPVEQGVAVVVCGPKMPLKVVRRTDKRVLFSIPSRDYLMRRPVASDDGRWIFTSTWKGRGGALWNGKTGKLICEFPGQSANAAFSPAENLLAVSHQDGLTVLHVDSWTTLHDIESAQQLPVAGAVAFSPDGLMMAWKVPEHLEIRLFDVLSARHLAALPMRHRMGLESLMFTPDGSKLVSLTSRQHIYVWNVDNIRSRLRELGLHWDIAGNFANATRSR